jgi:hypothetical protein
MTSGRPATTRAYVAGQLIEFWEDPDRPFGCGEADLRRYVARRAWVTLFNAVVLTVGRPASQPGC